MPISVDELVARARRRREWWGDVKTPVSPEEMRALLSAGADPGRCFLQYGKAFYYFDAHFQGEWFVSTAENPRAWQEPQLPA